ncbi:hypothetical protein L615_003400000030 [Nocardioides sp. J9]|uniref:hypothetical protein n=1 Tax=unclassified Nocardioides TaxID=2615069 RepID=UPI00048D6518|nr:MULTISPECIES: hypothetical protein [unclassified Nocardioides]TWG97754.1 hypothetical protein L615_003400000030 [Nocardioides sp. J9]
MVACVALWLGHSPALLPLVVVGAAGTVVLMAVGSWMAFVVSSSVAALLLLDLLVPGGRREQVRPGEAD